MEKSKILQPEVGSWVRVTGTEVCVTVSGILGHSLWKDFVGALDIAEQKRLPFAVDMKNCLDASMGGLGLLLKAHGRLGSISMRGCRDRVAYLFDGLGVCGKCGGRTDPVCRKKREQLRGLSVLELNQAFPAFNQVGETADAAPIGDQPLPAEAR